MIEHAPGAFAHNADWAGICLSSAPCSSQLISASLLAEHLTAQRCFYTTVPGERAAKLLRRRLTTRLMLHPMHIPELDGPDSTGKHRMAHEIHGTPVLLPRTPQIPSCAHPMHQAPSPPSSLGLQHQPGVHCSTAFQQGPTWCRTCGG